MGAPCTLFFWRQFTQILFRGREVIHSPPYKPKRNENCESRHPLDWLGRSNQDGEEAIEVQSPSSSSFTSLSSSRASTLIGGRVTAVADWAGGGLVNQLLNKRLNIIIVIKIIVAIIVVVVLIAVVVLVVVVVIIIVNTINPKLSSPSSSSWCRRWQF